MIVDSKDILDCPSKYDLDYNTCLGCGQKLTEFPLLYYKSPGNEVAWLHPKCGEILGRLMLTDSEQVKECKAD